MCIVIVLSMKGEKKNFVPHGIRRGQQLCDYEIRYLSTLSLRHKYSCSVWCPTKEPGSWAGCFAGQHSFLMHHLGQIFSQP